MDKVQPAGVESLALYKFQAAPVQVIARQGMAKACHMHPDLMGAACFQFEFHQA